jgi:hypothetical protein
MPTTDRGALLELRRDPDGLRHFLDGRAVHCGTALELLLAGDNWLPGRYECDLHDERSASQPLFYVVLGGDWEELAAPTLEELDGAARMPMDRAAQVCVTLPPTARLRLCDDRSPRRLLVPGRHTAVRLALVEDDG